MISFGKLSYFIVMVISLIHPHTCGFAKAAVWQVTRAVVAENNRDENETPKQHQARNVQEIHKRFTHMFAGRKFAIDFKTFHRKLPDLRKKFSTWNSRKIQERQLYLDAFSADNWDQQPPERKAEHSLMDCQGCFHRYSVFQSFFPVASQEFKGCLKENPVVVAQGIASKIRANPVPVKCTQREYQHGAQNVYDNLNPVFQRTYNVSLEKAFTTIKNLNIQTKKSKADEKKESRNYLRKAKTCLEKQWKKTSVMR